MKIKLCRSCQAEIVFLRTVNNKPMPVDAKSVGLNDKVFDQKKGHVSHYATCPWAAAHRKAQQLPSLQAKLNL